MTSAEAAGLDHDFAEYQRGVMSQRALCIGIRPDELSDIAVIALSGADRADLERDRPVEGPILVFTATGDAP